jgi:hypothetical protein
VLLMRFKFPPPLGEGQGGGLQGQRGQALLVVLGFVAALLLLVWAALTLASGAFLGQGNVRTDTRNTYALDAGLAYAIQANDSAAGGGGCNNTSGSFTLSYSSGTITVNVTMTAIPGCKPKKPTYNVTVAAPGATTRQLSAQISSSNAGKKATWTITWEQFQ